jgi:hypothetical protein
VITREDAEREMQTGLCAVCAWCEHWHDAKAKRNPTQQVACGKDCGGPSSLRAFPLYKGPYSGNLGKICFVCGEDAEASVQIEDGFLGVCGKHIQTVRDIMEQRKVTVVERTVPICRARGGIQ